MTRNFRSMLEARWADTMVCVGLDTDAGQIPEAAWAGTTANTMFEFNRAIVDATADLVCAFKPNIAFYEDQGVDGLKALIATTAYIRKKASDVPIILDAKRADIGNTNKGYVRAAFHQYGVDAITVNPYLGGEALEPFLKEGDKGIIVLCRTSNPGAGELQDLQVPIVDDDGPRTVPLYQCVAMYVALRWNQYKNCAVVVGATYPDELREVRKLVYDMPILVPGVGTQGGDVEKTVAAGIDSRGQGMIINSSRGIIFASKGADFAEAARQETLKLRNMINQCRAAPAAREEDVK